MIAAEPLVVPGAAAVPAQLTANEQVYYTLSHLTGTSDAKAVLFVGEGAFTLKIETQQRRETHDGRKYFVWLKELALTTTVKRNARGLLSVNVFRTVKGAKLTNESLNPNVFTALERLHPLLAEAYMAQLARTYRQVAGAAPAVQKVAIPRPFVGEHVKIDKGAFVYADFVRYAYPAYAEHAARSGLTSTGADYKLEAGFPEAFVPYLREPSWERMVTKLFGTRLPTAVREGLAPERVTLPQLAGAFMTRSLVPAAELLRRPYEPDLKKRGSTGWRLLAEARRALRALDGASRKALLTDFSTRTSDFKQFEKDLLGYTYAVAQGGKQLAPLPKLQPVTRWTALGRQLVKLYSGVLQAQEEGQQIFAEQFQRAAAECFTSLAQVAALNAKGLLAVDAYGSTRYVWNLQQGGVNFDASRFGPKNFLPHNSPLDRARKLLRTKVEAHRKDALLSYADATEVLGVLRESLDNMLRRHNLARTARNRTRAFVALFMFLRSGYAKGARVTENWWALIASDLPLPNVFEAFILNADPAEYAAFLQSPATTRYALSGYQPYLQKHAELEGF